MKSPSSFPLLPSTFNLRPYPAYKDSGVSWLGKIPEHWEFRRAKFVLREKNQRSIEGTEQLLRVSQYTGVTPRIIGSDSKLTRASSLVGYKLVETNDLVVNIMLAWNGSLGISPCKGLASPAYCVYGIRNTIEPRHLHYLLRTPVYKGKIRVESTGVVESRLRLYTDDLGRIEIILPPREDQLAIVRFLDYTDRRIRRYIRAKQKLIALLNEQKQAIIHKAVTRGLDPNVRLKPSGVEWLGDVPEHWEVVKLKHLCKTISKGTTPSTEGKGFSDKGIRFIKAENVSDGKVMTEPSFFIDEDTDQILSRSRLQKDDILIVIAGATIGKVGVVTEDLLPANTNQAVCFLRLRDAKNQRFLRYVLQSGFIQRLVQLQSVQSAQPNLAMGVLGSFPISSPSDKERDRIVKLLDSELHDINLATERAFAQISLIKEYRTRLIADVVTGKLDVREVASRLPLEPEEAEPTEEPEPLESSEENNNE